jgi:hypothetical protein
MVNGKDAGGLFGMPFATALILLIILFLILIGIVFILAKVRRQVNVVTGEDARKADDHSHAQRSWFGRQVTYFNDKVNKTLLVVVLATLLSFVSVALTYHHAQDLGTQIGYAPEQPIKFNHKIHAGQYGIQCQYCHTGVDKSKNATIPSLSTCMNCHNTIKSGPQYGTTEIAKIYKAMDYDPTTHKYGNHPTPVKWIRIHNLPDHVFFSHAQHVNAGKLACENCHGKVQEMERVQQTATLEMGWCINCHREKTINTDNPYYTTTFDFIQKHKKYTVAQMGGIECSKCHY